MKLGQIVLLMTAVCDVLYYSDGEVERDFYCLGSWVMAAAAIWLNMLLRHNCNSSKNNLIHLSNKHYKH